jgi:hypothetical protein
VLFVDAAMQGRYRAHDVIVGAHGGYTVVNTTRLQQIEDYGQRGEHLLPPDTGGGFLWRIHSIWLEPSPAMRSPVEQSGSVENPQK